jgi:tryptophan 2,3-dioxygenase
MSENKSALTYSTYLAVDELLGLQRPLSDGPEHDEMLFIIIHQTYELWFKQLKHELKRLQATLEAGETFTSISILGRIRNILKICVSQVDILETMTPLQFNSFRGRLDSSSGFQSAQFREVEGMLGRRDEKFASHLTQPQQDVIRAITNSRSLWDSALVYFAHHGHHIPSDLLNRDFSQGYEANPIVQEVLVSLHKNNPDQAIVCEKLLDVDEGLQEWRYRHVKMVERTIGHKSGTGGSQGVGYLASTLFKPVFPDLWAIRNRF